MPERPVAVVPPWRWWTGFAVVSATALYLTVQAYFEGLPDVFKTVANFDKLAHFGFAGLLAFFLDGALRRRVAFRIGRYPIALAAVLVLVPAGIEEYLQRYALFRTASVWDFTADVIGVIVLIPLSRRAAK